MLFLWLLQLCGSYAQSVDIGFSFQLYFLRFTDCDCFTARAEMESVLLSVARERKAQSSQDVFIDSLLQSSLTDTQVPGKIKPSEISVLNTSINVLI